MIALQGTGYARLHVDWAVTCAGSLDGGGC